MDDEGLERLDRLVKEYLVFREKTTDSTEGIVDRFMKAFDTGDYPTILTLWDSYVAQRIDSSAERHLVEQADTSEFYMHLHCATCPFRSSVFSSMGNPTAAAKLAARSMTIFKHYLENKGKRLAATSAFQDFKGLHKIAFPPTHPKYSYLFHQDWITSTREMFFQFLIPFIQDQQQPQLCKIFTAHNHRKESATNLVNFHKEREIHLMHISKSILEYVSDFSDQLLENNGISDTASIEQFQHKLSEYGKAILPHSPELPHAHRNTHESSSIPKEGSMNSSETSLHLSKKKKKHKKKGKVQLDYALIGCDLSSMMLELATELSSLMTDNKVLPIDSEMAYQSAIQGSLLIRALRNTVINDEAKQSFSPRSQSDVGSPILDEVQKQKIGTTEKIILSMIQGDLFGLDNGENGLQIESLLQSLLQAMQHSSDVPLIQEPNDDKSSIDAEGAHFIQTVFMTQVFVENYVSLLAVLSTHPSGSSYFINSKKGESLFSQIIKVLVTLKPTKSNMMVKLHVCCLCLLIALGYVSSNYRQMFVVHGGLKWLSKALEGLQELSISSSIPYSEDYLDLCLGMLHLVAQDEVSRNVISGCNDEYLDDVISISFVLLNSIQNRLSKLKEGIRKSHRASEVPAEEILIFLLDIDTVRLAIRNSSEVKQLKTLMETFSVTASVDVDPIKLIIRTVETLESREESKVSQSVSDVIYASGVQNLVVEMLSALEEIPEVLKYSEENLPYSDDNHILEKYKQAIINNPDAVADNF